MKARGNEYLTPIYDEIALVLEHFNAYALSEKHETNIRRFDKKYLCPVSDIPSLLNISAKHFDVLEVNGQRMLHYQSRYLDTKSNSFYFAHHNGKLNRYKARIRDYTDSGDRFLEIKHKDNKGEMRKKRLNLRHTEWDSVQAADFIDTKSPFKLSDLRPLIATRYQRIALSCKQTAERVTIDCAFSVENDQKIIALHELAIIEIKTPNQQGQSVFHELLRSTNATATGFSKYCTGMALLYPELKSNQFKPRLLKIKKIQNELNSLNHPAWHH